MKCHSAGWKILEKQAPKSTRADISVHKHVAGGDNTIFFAELLKLLTSGHKLYKAKWWWSVGIVEILSVLRLSVKSSNGENKPQNRNLLIKLMRLTRTSLWLRKLLERRLCRQSMIRESRKVTGKMRSWNLWLVPWKNSSKTCSLANSSLANRLSQCW